MAATRITSAQYQTPQVRWFIFLFVYILQLQYHLQPLSQILMSPFWLSAAAVIQNI